MAGRLDGKVCVITGATAGIGAATARRFHEEGARVVIAGRSRDKGEALARALGERAAFRKADVIEEDDIAGLIAFAVERFGRLDCLFNNAGSETAIAGIEKIEWKAYRYDIDVLLGGVLFGMKHAVPHMRRQRSGSIINNASIAGHRCGYATHVYSAAKAAVAHLTRCVAMEVAEHNVRVNAISPGYIPTSIWLSQAEAAPNVVDRNVARLEAHFATLQPLPLAGLPVEVANAAVYLASDDSRFVTGHDLVVDAGEINGLRPATRRERARAMREAVAGTG
jgi:NAD(P)-dependent dehydrogenase (short-subunit alcohol dehydrogenase family)